MHDHALDLREFVAGEDEESTGVLAHALVGVALDREPCGAVRVCAFAEVNRLARRVTEALLEVGDLFVDLAEDHLVARCPFLPRRRHNQLQK